MTDVLVRCPRTRTVVSTGLKAEWVVVASLPLTMPLRCPSCGGTHRWKPSESWIGAPPSQAFIGTATSSRLRVGEAARIEAEQEEAGANAASPSMAANLR
jgi:hypothetical protein